MKACIVIPCYDHGASIGRLVTALAGYGLPIYVVDDGSGPATQAELARVRAQFPLVRLSRLPQNSGKGSAVEHAMRHALADGMTHALQIDADGQHDPADVARFLERARARPDAVICGQAQFDASVPRARFYGRYLTHACVWLETLSFDIQDSMCGYRLYPLAALRPLLEADTLPPRMDYDTAVLVRLHWRGVPVEQLRTRVIYPPGGLSHFRMVRDNLRLIRMHALLIAGMLLRAPLLVARRLRRST